MSIRFSNNTEYFQFENSYKCNFCINYLRYESINDYIIKNALNNNLLRSQIKYISDQNIYELLMCKFEQNEDLKIMLLTTLEKKIIYDNPDSYWGIGLDNKGSNKLGKILMIVRESLKYRYRLK